MINEIGQNTELCHGMVKTNEVSHDNEDKIIGRVAQDVHVCSEMSWSLSSPKHTQNKISSKIRAPKGRTLCIPLSCLCTQLCSVGSKVVKLVGATTFLYLILIFGLLNSDSLLLNSFKFAGKTVDYNNKHKKISAC